MIEKRRRDRINHCLMELRRLVPQAISKEGSTKLEKAEILQMTVEHLRALQHTYKGKQILLFLCFLALKSIVGIDTNDPSQAWPIFDAHTSGFRECVDEISRYLISVEGFDVQHPLRLRLLSHLECFTDRSTSPSSHQSWPVIHQPSPSAFATPPLSSYSSPPMGYHPHLQQQQQQHPVNLNFNLHHYQRPPIDSSCPLPSITSSSSSSSSSL